MSVRIQKPPECPELVPSLPGANDGRAKWAEVLVIGASAGAFSVTTPSWRDEAQAESSHAITKASIPNHAAPLFTKPNLPTTAADANRGIRGLMSKSGHEKVLRGKRSSRLVLHGRQLGRA
jgi:hypothetical protein